MTIKEVVTAFQREKQEAVASRFPCRAIMVKNIKQYRELLSELKKISDIRVVQTSELFSNADVMPCFDNLKNPKYQNQWVILTGISEYLRLFSKKEQTDRRFANLWSYQAPASSTGRIIIPLWGCEAQWFDSALNFMGDLRQQDFYYDCSDLDAQEQILTLTILSGVFEKYIANDTELNFYNKLLKSLPFYTEYVRIIIIINTKEKVKCRFQLYFTNFSAPHPARACNQKRLLPTVLPVSVRTSSVPSSVHT